MTDTCLIFSRVSYGKLLYKYPVILFCCWTANIVPMCHQAVDFIAYNLRTHLPRPKVTREH